MRGQTALELLLDWAVRFDDREPGGISLLEIFGEAVFGFVRACGGLCRPYGALRYADAHPALTGLG
jgi:hypothetical protein